MTYLADTTGKRTHRVGYYLAFDGIPTRFATHRFDELVKPTTATAHAWWPINETTNSAFIDDALGNYPLNAAGAGTPDPAPSFLQPTTAGTGSRYFTAEYDIRFLNSNTVADQVIERGSVSAGFRPDTVTGTEIIFSYAGNLGGVDQNIIMQLSHVGTEIEVRWRDSGASDITSTTSGAGLTIGVPYHVLITWKTTATTDLSIYLWQVGSGLVHEESFSGLTKPDRGTSSQADFIIGATRAGANAYNGYLEDVVLWKIHHSRDKALAYLNLFSAPFEPALDLSGISASGSSLDRARSLVVPGGFSARLMDGATQRHILSRRGGTEDEMVYSEGRTTSTLSTVSGAHPDGAVAYLERETVLMGTKVPATGDFLRCQRGAWNSQAASHGGGMVLSSRPRHMMGRRGSLVAVDLDTYNAQTLRAGILSSSPQFSDGAYDLEFVDVQKELNRPLMRGWLPQKSADWSVVGYGVDVIVPDSLNFKDGSNSFIRVDGPDLLRVHTLASGTVTTGTHTVRLDLASIRYDESAEDVAIDTGAELELRQVAIITQDPATAALQVMLSVLGDGTNHPTHDVLPGRAPDATAPIRQVGAGIPSDWVDVAAWEALRGIGGVCIFYLEEETRLLDFLINEISWRLGGYIYVTDDGKISFQRYVSDVPAAAMPTISKSDILAGSVSVVDDESETVGRVSIECNYNPIQREFRARHQVVFADLNGTYGDDLANVELQSKSLWIGTGGTSLNSPPTEQWGLINDFDRVYSRTKNGVRKVRFQLPWKQHLTVRPGYVFKLTDDRLPDFAGSEGITGRTHEVTAANPDPQSGSLEVEAEEIPKGYLVAPSALVSSYGSGTFTLNTSTDFYGTEPGFDFMLGGTIRVFDADASPPFSASDTATITGLTASSITVSWAGSFTPASGDLIVLDYSTATGNTAANTGADAPDHLFHGNTRSTLA